ncbi:hypothetical protein ACFY3U_03255 [Micromonospora sp. NPDC000089]|uniref:hypothetical protein n=1 Tax=unclassified Micromonospora TaxID=2617518 RepID=UPI003694393D
MAGSRTPMSRSSAWIVGLTLGLMIGLAAFRNVSGTAFGIAIGTAFAVAFGATRDRAERDGADDPS